MDESEGGAEADSGRAEHAEVRGLPGGLHDAPSVFDVSARDPGQAQHAEVRGLPPRSARRSERL
jgi:hypothetical protein